MSTRSPDSSGAVDTRRLQEPRVEGKPLTIQRRVISAIREGPPGIAPPLEEAALI